MKRFSYVVAMLGLFASFASATSDHALVVKVNELATKTGTLTDIMGKASDVLGSTMGTLSSSSDAASEIDDVADTAAALSVTLLAASKIPNVGVVFKAPQLIFKKASDAMKKINSKVKSVDGKLDPIRNSIDKVDGVINFASEIIEPVVPMLQDVLEILVPASTCAARGDLGPQAKKAINEVMTIIENLVSAAERAVEAALVPLKKLDAYSSTMNNLASTFDAVNGVISTVGALTGPFEPLGKLMQEEISIPWFPETYGRGAGRSPDCPSNEEKDAGLCYPKCRSGYGPVGPVCWQSCGGFGRDDGAFCAKGSSYGRGAGRSPCTGCSGCSWRGCSGCSSCSTSRCKSNEEGYGALCYPKCRSGYKNDGCCLCSQKCPSGMTDIGVSCAKKSYGRGAGAVPKTCRDSEELNGLLCYPKCRAGYLPSGCCTCAQPAKATFTIGGLADEIAGVMDKLEGLPLLGEILGAIDTLVGAILDPVLSAIPGVPTDIAVDFSVDFNIANFPLDDTLEQLENLVMGQLEKFQTIVDDMKETLHRDLDFLPCPELAVPLAQRAVETFGVSSRPEITSSTPSPVGLLLSAVNENKECPLRLGEIVQQTVMKMSLSGLKQVMQGNNDDTKSASGKSISNSRSAKKREERTEAMTKAGLDGLKVYNTGTQGCSTASSTKNGRRLGMENVNIIMQSHPSIVAAKNENTESWATNGGFLVQRLDIEIPNGPTSRRRMDTGDVLERSIECVWRVKPDANDVPRFFNFKRSGATTGSGATNSDFSVELNDEKGLRASWHDADIGYSGFYLMQMNEFTSRASDFADYDDDECVNSPCPQGAGCRRSSVEAPVIGSSASGAWTKTILGRDQTGTFKVRTVVPKQYTQSRPIAETYTTKQNDPSIKLIFGPENVASADIYLQSMRMGEAITVARRSVERALGYAKALEENPTMDVDAITSKWLRLLFGMKINAENGESRFDELLPDVFADNGCENELADDFCETKKRNGQCTSDADWTLVQCAKSCGRCQVPLVYTAPSAGYFSGKMRAIRRKLADVYNFLQGNAEFTPLVFRHLDSDPELEDLPGYVVTQGNRKGNLHLNFDIFHIGTLAHTIVHESSHMISSTRDNFYNVIFLNKIGGFNEKYDYCKAGFPAKCGTAAYENLCPNWCYAQVADARAPSAVEGSDCSSLKNICLEDSAAGRNARKECPVTCMLELPDDTAKSFAFDRFLNSLGDDSPEYDKSVGYHPATLSNMWRGDEAIDRMINNADSIASFAVLQGRYDSSEMYTSDMRALDGAYRAAMPTSDASISAALSFA